jgi:isopentenyldiphosphate isomerase
MNYNTTSRRERDEAAAMAMIVQFCFFQIDQTVSDRPDMVARVFHLKKKELVDDIEKKQFWVSPQLISKSSNFKTRSSSLPDADLDR